MQIPFRKVYRTICDEVVESDYILQTLKDGDIDSPSSVMSLPGYLNHPHVVRAREAGEDYPLPLALYMDGVRYAGQAAGRHNV
eukprot:7932564-Pyramimonas_sp.AAC.1